MAFDVTVTPTAVVLGDAVAVTVFDPVDIFDDPPINIMEVSLYNSEDMGTPIGVVYSLVDPGGNYPSIVFNYTIAESGSFTFKATRKSGDTVVSEVFSEFVSVIQTETNSSLYAVPNIARINETVSIYSYYGDPALSDDTYTYEWKVFRVSDLDNPIYYVVGDPPLGIVLPYPFTYTFTEAGQYIVRLDWVQLSLGSGPQYYYSNVIVVSDSTISPTTGTSTTTTTGPTTIPPFTTGTTTLPPCPTEPPCATNTANFSTTPRERTTIGTTTGVTTLPVSLSKPPKTLTPMTTPKGIDSSGGGITTTQIPAVTTTTSSTTTTQSTLISRICESNDCNKLNY